jgi:hypothetical protein
MPQPVSFGPLQEFDNSHQFRTRPYAFPQSWSAGAGTPGTHFVVTRKSRSALRRNELGYVDSLGVLNGYWRIEEMVSDDDIAGGAGLLENADCGFVDRIVHDDIVVARDEDTRLGAVENLIETDTRLIALKANAIENGGRERFVAVDCSVAAVKKDVDLADASPVA